jgi:hypothetical protein
MLKNKPITIVVPSPGHGRKNLNFSNTPSSTFYASVWGRASLYVISRVYGSVTKNNGSGLDLLRSLLQSLVITINLQPNPSFLTAEDSHHSRSRSTTDLSITKDDCVQVKVTLGLAVYRQTIHIASRPWRLTTRVFSN